MKILLVPDQTAPNGQDAFCREFAKSAHERGHETHIQAIATNASKETIEEILSSKFAAQTGIILINGVQPGIFQAAKISGKKIVFRLIDSGTGEDPKTYDMAKNMALTSDRLLLPSKHLASIAKTWGCNGNIRIVPYAYDRIMAGQITLSASQPTRSAAFPLVACAPLREESRAGLETLFSAIARLRLDCHLSLIGEGPLLDTLRARARDFFISDRISFLGNLHPTQVGDCLRTAKAYVDPCGLDGFPNWALQALAEGCPVIAAKAGTLPEIIHNEKNGLSFTAGDTPALAEAIVTLYSMRGLSIQLIAEGVKTLEKHSWPLTAAAALSALEELA